MKQKRSFILLLIIIAAVCMNKMQVNASPKIDQTLSEKITELRNMPTTNKEAENLKKNTLKEVEILSNTSEKEASARAINRVNQTIDTLSTSMERDIQFNIYSDVHMERNREKMQYFEDSLEDFKYLSPQSAATLFDGDNTDNGSEAEYTNFYNVLAESNVVEPLVVLGNHEARWQSNSQEYKDRYLKWNSQYMGDVPKGQLYWSRWIDGYHFIGLNTELDLKDAAYISREQVAWLEEQLKVDASPDKPIFIQIHQTFKGTGDQTLADTIYYKDQFPLDFPERDFDGEEALKEVLRGYPQSVIFTGHVHNNIKNLKVYPRDYGHVVDLPDFKGQRAAYQVSVKDSDVTLKLRDFKNDKWLEERETTFSVNENAPPVEKENAYDVSFKGYNDREFAAFTNDRTKGEGRLETKSTGTQVHHVFDKEYASITVQDSQGKQTFNQSYKGTDTYNNKVDTMAIKEGDYLTFKHLEPNGGDTANGRLSIIDKQTDTTMEKAEVITYKVTKNGWVKAQKPQEPEEPIEIDQAYEVDFRGYMDREFAVFSHDLSEEKGRLETKATSDSIHYVFNKEYASVTVQDAKGKQTFNQSYKGTETYNAKVDTMAIKEGDYLTFKHLEPNGGDIPTGRLSIIDKQTNTAMEKAEVITYKVTKDGWVKAQKPQEPTENKPETPKNVNASQVTTSSVKLTWDKVNNADEYIIYRDGKKVSTSKENQFNETDLQENTTYSYQIEAIGKDGTSSEKSEPLKVTTKSSDIPNDIREWMLGSFSTPVLYTAGEKVSHKGKIYVVVTTHQNYGDSSWAPDKANSLFRLT